jgi:hypothetical protein
LKWLRGTYFPTTVADIDLKARTAAEGLRVAATTRITVELTDDQLMAVGLPPGPGYQGTACCNGSGSSSSWTRSGCERRCSSSAAAVTKNAWEVRIGRRGRALWCCGFGEAGIVGISSEHPVSAEQIHSALVALGAEPVLDPELWPSGPQVEDRLRLMGALLATVELEITAATGSGEELVGPPHPPPPNAPSSPTAASEPCARLEWGTRSLR